MSDQPRTFACPNCNEIISDSADTCRFCKAPVDAQAAAALGEIQSKVNRACSDASFLKIAAVTMWIFLGLSAIPYLPLVGYGFLITFFVVLILFIRWMVKFGGLQSNDADYQVAKRSAIISVILWLAAIPVGFVLVPMAQHALFS
jgi:Ca2+/Na+ antiporter